jgi:hypothetical protein
VELLFHYMYINYQMDLAVLPLDQRVQQAAGADGDVVVATPVAGQRHQQQLHGAGPNRVVQPARMPLPVSREQGFELRGDSWTLAWPSCGGAHDSSRRQEVTTGAPWECGSDFFFFCWGDYYIGAGPFRSQGGGPVSTQVVTPPPVVRMKPWGVKTPPLAAGMKL